MLSINTLTHKSWEFSIPESRAREEKSGEVSILLDTCTYVHTSLYNIHTYICSIYEVLLRSTY